MTSQENPNVYFSSMLTLETSPYGDEQQIEDFYKYNANNPINIQPVVITVGNPQISGGLFMPVNTVVVGNSFVSYSAGFVAQLTDDYKDLGAALADLKDSSADEWQIEDSVYDLAQQVASSLMEGSYPAPQVLTHGPKSVVFHWEAVDNRSLYLTISEKFLSALVSSPSKIERRQEVPVGVLIGAPLIDGPLIPRFIEWTQVERPIVSSGRQLESTGL
jgi:hypothetical protein